MTGDSPKIGVVSITRYGGGYGVVALNHILPGEQLASWNGHRYKFFYKTDYVAHDFDILDHAISVSDFLDDGSFFVQDSLGAARYFAHACNPNCVYRNMSLISRRSIVPGELLSFDYAMTEWDDHDVFMRYNPLCLCGSVLCRKNKLGFSSLLEYFPHVADAYISQGYVHEWILKKIKIQENKFKIINKKFNYSLKS